MFSDLAAIRAKLAERLKPVVPAAWEIVESLESARKSLAPVLYFEHTQITSAINGAPLPRTTVGCGIDLIIAAAGNDEDDADAHILDLVRALQGYDDILWDTANKTRIGGETGPLGWRISLTVLSTTT